MMYYRYIVLAWTLFVLLCISKCDANDVRSYAVSMDMPSGSYPQNYHSYNIYDVKLNKPRFSQNRFQSSKTSVGKACDMHMTRSRSSISSVNCSIFSMAARDFVGCDRDEGSFEVQNRIVGGFDVSITEVPYQVNYDDRCGGAILSEYWVITASHCKTTGTYVMVGSTKRGAGIMHKVEKHYPHPNFNLEKNEHPFHYDFQLLKLATPIVMSEYAAPVKIGDMSDIVPEAMLSITGWGYIKPGSSPVTILQRVDVPIISSEQCHEIPLELYCITKTMFCAGYAQGGKDACQGDSGGPATVNGKLVGLVSFGYGCAIAKMPGVYSMVPMVKDWIRSVTGLQI